MNTETLQTVFEAIGAISTLLTIAGALLPAAWPVTQWCAHLGANLRNVPRPGTDTPKA